MLYPDASSAYFDSLYDASTDEWRLLKVIEGASIWPISLWEIRNLDFDGQRWALMSGGNIGLGFETAKVLLQKGINVTLACREGARGEPSPEKTIKQLNRWRKRPDQTVEVWPCDFASINQVKALAKRWLETERPLHYLFNNAGMCLPGLRMTKEGNEIHYAVNFLSHVCLSLSLIPALKKAKSARIIQSSSCFHYFGGAIDWDKLNSLECEQWQGLKDYFIKYGRAKLCLTMFGKELNLRLAREAETSHIVVHTLHPGAVYTRIFTSLYSCRDIPRTLLVFTLSRFTLSTARGAKSLIKAALSNDDDRGTVGGRYWNRAWEVRPRPEVVDPNARRILWDRAVRECGLPEDAL